METPEELEGAIDQVYLQVNLPEHSRMSRRDDIAAALTSSDPLERAEALSEVGMLALGHGPVLKAIVAMTADARPLPDALQPPADDPFAAFFGAKPKKRTFGEHATERLFSAGLPGHPQAVATLKGIVLDTADPMACATVARLFAETRWEDPAAAARSLIPALHARDVSMVPVIAGADAITLEILITSAVSPYRSRAVNELMNDVAARSAIAAAIRGILQDLDDDRLAEALAVLVSWEAVPAGELASLEGTRPWVARFTALVDPSASDRAMSVEVPDGVALRLRELT